MRIGYGKLGRNMPLTLDDCGTVGGDMEGIAVVNELARRRPHDTFYLIGRNTGEEPEDVGLPPNIINPWIEWDKIEKEWKKKNNITDLDFIDDKQKMWDFNNQEISPFIRDLDGLVLWEGQHGSTNTPTPMTDDPGTLTDPQIQGVRYCSYMLQGVNAFRDRDPLKYEEIWLNADARNVRQSRDMRWPPRHPVLAQYNLTKNARFHRGRGAKLPTIEELNIPAEWQKLARKDGHLWNGVVKYVYSRVEINSLAPGIGFGSLVSYNEEWQYRYRFGLFINEARAYVNPKLSRKHVMQTWVLPNQPAFIHGKWSKESMKELNVDITVADWDMYYPKLHSVRSTFTTPSSGSGWATTKPWEAFAAGTVCFFHPDYDTQNHILADAPEELRSYLRTPVMSSLTKRIDEMNNDKDKWLHMVRMQKAHFDKAITELRYIRMIEERLDATKGIDNHHNTGTVQPA